MKKDYITINNKLMTEIMEKMHKLKLKASWVVELIFKVAKTEEDIRKLNSTINKMMLLGISELNEETKFVIVLADGKALVKAELLSYNGRYRMTVISERFSNIVNTEAITDHSIAEDKWYLSDITFPDGIVDIQTKAVLMKDTIGELTIKLPDSVCYIRSDAFSGAKELRKIQLPRELTNIEKYAFYCLHLKEVKFGPNIEKIGFSAFAGNKLKELEIVSDRLVKIEKHAFAHNEQLEKIVIKSKEPVSIHAFAFSSCLSLKELELPDNIEMIDHRAFYMALKHDATITYRNKVYNKDNVEDLKNKLETDGCKLDKDAWLRFKKEDE